MTDQRIEGRGPLVLDALVLRTDDQVVLEADRVVPVGTVVVVSGRDGSLVTAVLDHIVRELTAGPSAVVDDRALIDGHVRLGADGPAAPARSDVAVMTRGHALIGGLTAAENVALGILVTGPSASGDRVRAALDAVGLPVAVRDNLAEQLSGGQQQRVALARALVADAPVTVLDDPTSELDPASREVVHDALTAVAARGGIVVVGIPGSEAGPTAAVHLRIGRRGRHVRSGAADADPPVIS
jgi:ABC-type multidrug transport system ATPase subunit